MEEKTIEKALNRISEERLEDSKDLRNVKADQEKQQQSIQETKEQVSSLHQKMETFKKEQQILMQRIAVPIEQLEDFGASIDSHSELLKKPLIQKVVHEHHVPKLLYATVALFCVCVSFGVGWFQTGQHLNQYRNNDTKWRKLLLGAKPILTEIMQEVSTNVEQNPDNVRDSVENEETHNAQVWDLQQKMKADSAEMRALKTGKPAGDNSSYIHKK